MRSCRPAFLLVLCSAWGVMVAQDDNLQETISHTVLGEVPHNSDSLHALSFEADPMKFVAPIYAMNELRPKFNRMTPKKKASLENRWDFATWSGVGARAADIGSVPSALPNVGAGVRSKTEKRSNVRVDHRVVANSSAFCVTFFEAL